MAVGTEFGFFEAVDNDRLYYSDSFNKYFKGMIGYTARNSSGAVIERFSGTGIFDGIGDNLSVSPGTGLQVVVGTGKALVDYHWFELGVPQSIVISQNVGSRYIRRDAIVLRCNSSNVEYDGTEARSMEIVCLQGMPNDKRTPPTLNQYEDDDDGVYEMLLAYVDVGPNSVKITKNDIVFDPNQTHYLKALMGADAELNAMRIEYQRQMDAITKSLEKWLDTKQKTYDAWFYDLTESLLVGGYIQHYNKRIENTSAGSFPLTGTSSGGISGYTYDTDDVFLVTYNGLMLTKDYHFTVEVDTDNNAVLVLNTSRVGTGAVNYIDIVILKTNLAQKRDGTLSSRTGDDFVYIDDVAPSVAYGFKINRLSEENLHPVISYCNRNLADLSGFASSTTIDGITLTKNANGSFKIEGTNGAGEDIVFTTEVSTRAFSFNGAGYIISCGGSGDGGDGISFAIADTNDTIIAEADDMIGEYFLVTDETFGDIVKFKIIVSADTENANYTLEPQVEYGNLVHSFVGHEYGEFTYHPTESGIPSKPTFTDTFAFIWPKEDNTVHDMLAVYYILVSGSADSTYY